VAYQGSPTVLSHERDASTATSSAGQHGRQSCPKRLDRAWAGERGALDLARL
jgi:hypothetical protein